MSIKKWVIEDVLGETFRSNVCPRFLVSDKSMSLLLLHQHYRNAILPYAGGIYDQPNIYIEAMAIIDSRVAKIALERLEKKGAKKLR